MHGHSAARGAQGDTALMYAAKHKKVAVARLLIDKGADKEAKNNTVSGRVEAG